MIDFDNVENLIFGQPKTSVKKAPKNTKNNHKKPVKKGKRTIDLDRIENRFFKDRSEN